MLKGKTVTCRKPHICNACGETINTGEKASYRYGRVPIWEDAGNEAFWSDVQVGIWYHNLYFHIPNCLDENGEIIKPVKEAGKDE